MFRHRLIEVGSLVKYTPYTGIVTRVDPEEIGDKEIVEVTWLNGTRVNCSVRYLEVINESR